MPKAKAKLHMIELVVGDWSHDGHEKTKTFRVTCNKTAAKLKTAYKAGVEVCGLDLKDTVAVEYEDSILATEDASKLAAAGIPVAELVDGSSDNDGFCLTTDSFAELYMRIANLGAPDLTWDYVEANQVEVGGYGLFY